MAAFVSSRRLLPEGLVVESMRLDAGSIAVAARSAAGDAACPCCGSRSRRVHSRYLRTLSDLPCSGRVLRISVIVRRFRCALPTCRARIFAERLGEAIAAPFARRTSRLDRLTHHLGLALGGRPGAGLAARLLLPVSRRRCAPCAAAPAGHVTRRRSSASTTGRGSAGSATAR